MAPTRHRWRAVASRAGAVSVGALCKRAFWRARLETAPTDAESGPGAVSVGVLCKRAFWRARL